MKLVPRSVGGLVVMVVMSVVMVSIGVFVASRTPLWGMLFPKQG